MEVTIEFSFDFGEGVGRAFVGGGFVGPVGVHDEPGAVVDVVELLAEGALVGGVTLHEEHVGGHGDVGSAVTVALDDLVVAGVAGGLETDGAILAADGGLVQVGDADVGLVVPLLLVVLLEHEGVVKTEVVPSAGGVLVTGTFGAGDLIVIHDGGNVHHALEKRVLVELGEIAGCLGDVVRLIGELLVLVGEVNVEVTTTRAKERGDGKDGSSLSAAEHLFFFLNFLRDFFFFFFCKSRKEK